MQLNALLEIGAAAAFVSFVVSLLIVQSQKWHGFISNDHDLCGVQKVHGLAVPRIGGVAVLSGVVAGILAHALMFLNTPLLL